MSNQLRYKIVDWHQLVDVQSNNSSDLRVRVTDFINDTRLSGTRISVVHKDFGTLFSCLINASGSLITDVNDNISFEFTTDQILEALSKYGFIVEYNQKSHLPEGQLTFLSSLQTLGYDKLRILDVYQVKYGEKQYKSYLVVFNIEQNPSWIDNMHIASESEFLEALRNGSAVNVSATNGANSWSWGWLNFVANISDILEENA